MLNNANTANLIKKELENDLYLLEILKDDLINYSALARKLLPKIQKKNNKATLESIMVAIKRYVSKQNKIKVSDTIKKIIKDSQLSTKNDVVHMTFKRNEEILNEIINISKKIEWANEEIFFINQGPGEVTIILDKKNERLLSKHQRDLIEKTDNLALLSIKESIKTEIEESINVPGVYSYFINQLSRRSLNIIEIISTYSQLTLIFKNQDLMKAYSIIEESIWHYRE